MTTEDLLNVVDAASYLGIRPWTLRHWISDRKIDVVKYGNGIVRIRRSVLERYVASSTIKAERLMDEARRNRDFSKGPMWDPERNRWRVEIRYPDGSRLRKRFRREREAARLWSAEQTKIENGTWHERAPKTVTFETAGGREASGARCPHRSSHFGLRAQGRVSTVAA
jgi:excisionase family DNA binding protein